MGDPRRVRKKYSRPGHPWEKARLEEERALLREYGLVNKKELFKANSKIKAFASQAKHLITLTTEQARKETTQLINKMARLGLLSPGAKLDDVLNLKTKDLLERRLQTVVFKRGLARTPQQARQFITHNHILLNDKVLSVPGYIVPISEEANITFRAKSTLSNPDHPERAIVKKEEQEEKPERPAKKKTDKKGEKKTQKKEVKQDKKETKSEKKEKKTDENQEKKEEAEKKEEKTAEENK